MQVPRAHGSAPAGRRCESGAPSTVLCDGQPLVRPAVSERHWQAAGAELGTREGVFLVGTTDMPKQGVHSVGVARQSCGRLGKIENCQAGVFVAYAGEGGATLVYRWLFLTEAWAGNAAYAERCRHCGVPAAATDFRTQLQLVLKRNQPTLHAEVRAAFADAKQGAFTPAAQDCCETVECNGGRERHTCTVLGDQSRRMGSRPRRVARPAQSDPGVN